MCHRRTICLDSVKAPEILYGVAGRQTIDQTTTTTTIQPFLFPLLFFFFGVCVCVTLSSYQLGKEGSECFICVVDYWRENSNFSIQTKNQIFDYYC